jgi:hypothetical protein
MSKALAAAANPKVIRREEKREEKKEERDSDSDTDIGCSGAHFPAGFHLGLGPFFASFAEPFGRAVPIIAAL